jgi:phosphoglucan,water dikinase
MENPNGVPEKKEEEIFQIEPVGEASSMDPMVLLIMEADKGARNWREKLNAFLHIISDEEFEPTPENMACLAIYARFIGTGEVKCAEDGRHFRPSHHARAAQAIEKRLVELTTNSNSFIIRKIYPWLPSYHSAFTRQEPLTRIRDIAHRNDIPKELKSEIKHTLQNKLHRSAGPEDLATSENILKRITAPGAEYSQSFVEEFKIFHDELKDFFNAYSLEERLKSIIEKGDAEDTGPVTEFLALKKEGGESAAYFIKTLAMLTTLRKKFRSGYLCKADAKAQLLRLSDIGLEEFAFVLLSGLANLVEKISSENTNWDHLFNVFELALCNVQTSDFEKEECECLMEELRDIQKEFSPSLNEHLLRLKALVERCQRLSDAYSEKILALFHGRIRSLGEAFNVSPHAVKFFAEGDIRRNILFQLSRITSFLSLLIREIGGLPKWDIIVPGMATGRLVLADRIEELAHAFPDDVILLLEKVEGDEAIPEGVKGMVLVHPLPHLSHLSIRARQDRVVFAVCGDRAQFKEMANNKERMVLLETASDAVELKPLERPGHVEEGIRIKRSVAAPRVDLSPTEGLIPLDKILLFNGGAKAAGLRRLEELSRQRGAGFKTLPGVVIPFAAMKEALALDNAREKEYNAALYNIDDKEDQDISGPLRTLRDITAQLAVPSRLCKEVKERFGGNVRLMARSSSNCEDLKDFAGAGMYESVANVRPEHAGEAISRVWASLWRQRAARGRLKAGISHSGVHMAVVIQEMVYPELSFVMHTVHPAAKQKDEILIELAVGMGEALTSAHSAGTPYRMTYNKKTGETRMLAFASLGMACVPGQDTGLAQKRVLYTKVPMTTDSVYRKKIGARLGAVGAFVEQAMGYALDIEGAISGKEEIYLVQARAQQGI